MGVDFPRYSFSATADIPSLNANINLNYPFGFESSAGLFVFSFKMACEIQNIEVRTLTNNLLYRCFQ